MKIKTWHLFLVIVILFGCSFYVVNLKFDKFYRVNGINNDNRVLIEKYLDEDEQRYLILNQIPIDKFIDYIQEEDFYLQNYQYYNYLKASKRYTSTSDILDVGNSLATRLSYLYKGNALNQAVVLIDSSLELAFLNEENFQFEYIDLYRSLSPLYQPNDYSFVHDTETYVGRLADSGVTNFDEVKDIFQMMAQSYSKKSLSDLMNANIEADVERVYNPSDLKTIVDKNHYIATYEPKGLLFLQDIPRVQYAMYLQDEAYRALLSLYDDMRVDVADFLLKEAYVGSESLPTNEIGYREEQLGLTITVTQAYTPYKNFSQTSVSKWLEKNAYKYGYVLRYPSNKASITNKAYDPHIYRYVGIETARTLYENNLALEELSRE